MKRLLALAPAAFVVAGILSCTQVPETPDLVKQNFPTDSAPPAITTHPQPQSATVGNTATFVLLATGTNITYQWLKDSLPIGGATSASYTTPATVLADNGTSFRCIVSNSAGSDTSNPAKLTVVAQVVAPGITSNPQPQSVTVGQTATFAVVATGTDLSYQWQKDTVNISGATSASYTTPVTASADSGRSFRCVVTNSAGSMTSNAALLSVSAQAVAPGITTNPQPQSVTVGQTATFTVVATGTSLTYQWQKDTVNISGATNASYTTSSTVLADSGRLFRCVVTNSAGSVTSNAALLSVSAQAVAPGITTNPQPQSVTVGQTATFTVVATGTNLTYQWQKGTANIAGATLASYTTPATTVADDSTTYRCVVTNSAGSVTSNSATLIVTAQAVAPGITTNPQPQSVTAGQTATFAVVATGTNLTYQWQKGTVNIAGATLASYTTSVTTVADDSTTYRCVVTNSTGSVTSNPATLIVAAQVVAPSITTNPQPQSVTAGQTATFAIVAAGTNLTYQWQKGTANIAGATLASYTTPATTVADDSTTYRCVVTNSAGSVTSNPATLVVAAQVVAPGITTNPQPQSVSAGQTATFTVVASGTNLTYQWQKGTANIAGATLASYTTPPTTVADDSTTYRCLVANSAGNAMSNSATLTVAPVVIAPSITSQPQSQSVTAGQTATFSITATGTNLAYQWQKGGANIAGATLASYTTPITITADDGSTFRCIVSNTAGNATSNPATLSVAAQVIAPTITTQPQPQSVTVGQAATFSVAATGTDLTYQWQKGTTNIAGATLTSYTTPVTALGDNGTNYRCVVTNSANSVTSNSATLTVADVAPSITTQPQSQAVTVGGTASFSVIASGTNLTYQWQKGAANISGAISASYTTPATTIADNNSTYRCVVTNSASSATSTSATLTVADAAPSITTQPQPQSVTVGQTATFSVVAAGSNLTYQWQKGAANISGATSASYTTPATTIADNNSTYRCVVTNTANSATSTSATLTVAGIAPSITTQPQSQTVTAGQNVAFSVTATGTPSPSYQWSKGGSAISGATSSSYSLTNVQVSDAGTYTVVVSNGTLPNATSNDAVLTVTDVAPSITTQPQSQSITAGQTATFSVAASGTNLTYQWQKGAANIAGATAPAYITPVTTASDDGTTYRCVVSNSAGSLTSNSATLTVLSPVVITTQPQSQTVTSGQTVTFSVRATGSMLAYQWQQSGTPIAGATSNDYVIAGVTAAYNGNSYHCIVTGSLGNVTTNDVTLTLTGSTVTDIDGNITSTVIIGKQEWMTQNLRVQHFNDGSVIPVVTDPAAWAALTTPGYCWYNNDNLQAGFGGFYNWFVVSTGKLAPAGWHVPTQGDWNTLVNYAGGTSAAGGKLKLTGTADWNAPNTGATNELGFAAFGRGYRGSDGTFQAVLTDGYWWTSSGFDASTSFCSTINYNSAAANLGNFSKNEGFNVRCIKN